METSSPHYELQSNISLSHHLLKTGNVWRNPGWEPAGGCLWASCWIPRGLLESDPHFNGHTIKPPAGTQPGPHHPHPVPKHHLWTAGTHLSVPSSPMGGWINDTIVYSTAVWIKIRTVYKLELTSSIFCLFVFSVFTSISRAKECDRATTQVTILLPTSGATWWHRRKISTMSGRTKDATACPLARSIAESIRTPTRTTRIPIRMHTSRTATEVHLAATATTPDIGSEPSSIEQPEPRRPRFYPHSMLQQSQDIPWLYIFFRLACWFVAQLVSSLKTLNLFILKSASPVKKKQRVQDVSCK